MQFYPFAGYSYSNTGSQGGLVKPANEKKSQLESHVADQVKRHRHSLCSACAFPCNISGHFEGARSLISADWLIFSWLDGDQMQESGISTEWCFSDSRMGHAAVKETTGADKEEGRLAAKLRHFEQVGRAWYDFNIVLVR
jgi:hypothetical protein